jgi:CheY-like chemotaxis protein
MQQFHTLCIADDDFEDRMLLIDAVKSLEADIEIIEAGDGFELLEILQSKKPSKQSLIILDMNMPKLNGLETLEKSVPLPSWHSYRQLCYLHPIIGS